jgi:flavin-dependent dehydrogenase
LAGGDLVSDSQSSNRSPNRRIAKRPDVDVLVVGAGPAGTVAATLLARHGARVRLLDRAAFPRDKLCGDTVNPGALAVLRRLRLAGAIDSCGLPIHGMRLSGANGVVVDGRYPDDLVGRALLRRHLDWMLLQDAMAAGVQFEPSVSVRRAIVEDHIVSGVVLDGGRELRASVTIAADGRRSALAFGLGLAVHPPAPRRWAIGAYFDVPADTTTPTLGEMHVRGGHYIGVAPVPGGLTNVCLVKSWRAGDAAVADPRAAIVDALARDPLLADRFAGATMTTAPVVLGPLAVDAEKRSIDGLLLAGDAAGFIDPMTGDGLHFAIRGAELTAAAALDSLANGWGAVHARLAQTRRAEFARKWRFNRTVRSLVASKSAVAIAAAGARFAPAVLRRVMIYSGDCGVARSTC